MSFLRKVLFVDSFVCFGYGTILVAGALPLAQLFAFDNAEVLGCRFDAFITLVGILVLVVGAVVMVVAWPRQTGAISVWPIIFLEVVWISGSVSLLASHGGRLTVVGQGFVILSGAVVLAFMLLELLGLQRISRD